MNAEQEKALRQAARCMTWIATSDPFGPETRKMLEAEVEDAQKRLAIFIKEGVENAQRVADLLENLPSADELLEGIEE